MTKKLALLFVSLIAGCAVIPGTESTLDDTRSRDPFTTTSNRSPMDAAKCVISNIEQRHGSMDPSMRPGASANAVEIRVRSPVGMAAVIDVLPRATGSTIETRVSNHYPLKAILASHFVENC